MDKILLYFGIGVIVAGWLILSWFSARQINAGKEYERLPQKWQEIKRGYVKKRWICRGLIIAGLVLVMLSILL